MKLKAVSNISGLVKLLVKLLLVNGPININCTIVKYDRHTTSNTCYEEVGQILKEMVHYENLPMQIYWIFYHQKIKKKS